MPLALRAGQGSEIYSPLGKTIFGGLITSSLITLIIIPVIYYRVELSLETRRKNNEEKILQLN
jgi:HAE1 family hydrophobic/amphiphilic exporter-1